MIFRTIITWTCFFYYFLINRPLGHLPVPFSVLLTVQRCNSGFFTHIKKNLSSNENDFMQLNTEGIHSIFQATSITFSYRERGGLRFLFALDCYPIKEYFNLSSFGHSGDTAVI